jgi:hypothetical protein
MRGVNTVRGSFSRHVLGAVIYFHVADTWRSRSEKSLTLGSQDIKIRGELLEECPLLSIFCARLAFIDLEQKERFSGTSKPGRRPRK